MFIYQIEIPVIVDDILGDPTFMWMLTKKVRSKDRYKELNWVVLRGYKFEKVIVDLHDFVISIYLKEPDFAAVQELLNHFSICTRRELSFPVVQNKKSFTI